MEDIIGKAWRIAREEDVSTAPDGAVVYSVSYMPTSENKTKAQTFVRQNKTAKMLDLWYNVSEDFPFPFPFPHTPGGYHSRRRGDMPQDEPAHQPGREVAPLMRLHTGMQAKPTNLRHGSQEPYARRAAHEPQLGTND